MSIYILPRIPYSYGDQVEIMKSLGSTKTIKATVKSIEAINFKEPYTIHLRVQGGDKRTVIVLLEAIDNGWISSRIIYP